MKKLLTALTVLMMAPYIFADSTFVAGTIVNGSWTPLGSPYCVTGDIFVAGLTIEPGVEVVFLGNYVFEVGGVLTAIGTEQDSIKFTKVDTISSWKGILFQNSVPGSEMSWCIVENANTSGIRIFESFPILNHCVIRDNRSGESGGGLKISLTISGDLEISDCIISNNVAPSNYTVPTSHGGGIWVSADNGTVRFVNCTIKNNQATTNDGNVRGGGGWVTGNVEFMQCTIKDNLVRGQETIPGGSSSGRGGGIYIQDGYISFLNTSFISNTAIGTAPGGMQGNTGYASGGGIHINNGQVTFLNSIIGDNFASGSHGTQGGGLFTNDGQTVMENCALAWNNVQAIHNNIATVNVINSIIFFNNNNNAQIAGNVSITYSDVQGGYQGDGNINFNPIFYSQTCLHVVTGSPCIDAGDSSAIYNDVCFPPSLGTVRNDMGAHGGPGACNWDSLCIPTVSIEDESIDVPIHYSLEQNYPNPFNPNTTIQYQLPKLSHVEIKIYNFLGQLVKTLVNEKETAGVHQIQWDGRNEKGEQVASGVYLYRLTAGSFIQTHKMILLR